MCTFANTEDPGSILFVMVKKIFRKKNTISSENCNLTPLDMFNGLSEVYCIKPEGRFTSIQRVNNMFVKIIKIIFLSFHFF